MKLENNLANTVDVLSTVENNKIVISSTDIRLEEKKGAGVYADDDLED